MPNINWEDLKAGTYGTLDELLLGAPEWLLKQFGDRKSVEDYIKAHEKAYRTGETIGTVGGAFIPVGGMARGAKSAIGLGKAAKGAKALLPAAETAARPLISELARLAGRGAAAGGAEAAARGLFDEESAGQIAQDISQGTLFGGLGGAAGGLLSKSLSSGLDRLQKATAGQYLKGRGISARALKKAFNQSMPVGAKENYKVQKVGEYLREVTDFMKKIPRKEGSVEALSAASDAAYDALNKAFASQWGDIPAPKLVSTLIDHIDFDRVAREYGDEAAQQARDIIVNNATGKKGLRELKSFLQNQFNMARESPKIAENSALSSAMQDIASSLKSNLDDIAVKLMEREGGTPINVRELNKAYKLSAPLKISETTSTLTPQAIGGGSPTFDKAAMSQLLAQAGIGAGIGGATNIAQASGIDTGNEIANRAISSVLGAVAGKALSGASSRLIGAIDTPIAKLAAKVTPEVAESLAPTLAVQGGRLAENVQREAAKAAAPTTPDEAEAASDGAEAGQTVGTPQYTSLILGKLSEFATANGIEPDSQDYKDFVQAVGSATMSADGQPFDPRKMAKLLYPDAGQREKYLTALDVSQRLSASLAPAVKAKGGVFGIGEDVEERINRETALNKLGELVADVSKGQGTEKKARDQLATILGSRATQAEKKKLVRHLLETYGVDFDVLSQVGI